MELNTATYAEMYDGSLVYVDPEKPSMPPIPDNNPLYYNGNIGFEFTGTHKLAQDKPTVTIIIPCDILMSDLEGEMPVKRLKYYLHQMQNDTATYKEMYDGRMEVQLEPKIQRHRGKFEEAPPETEIRLEPVYWHEDTSIEIDETHKLVKDKPTVTFKVPCNKLIQSMEGDVPLKRLKYYLHQMQNDTATYKEMYDGEMELKFPSTAWDGHEIPSEIEKNPIYWHQDNALELSETHKLAKDKPTLTWHIPAEKLRMETYTTAAADYCLREFKKYIDVLNAELYNRSRPDNENGKYYLYTPGGEVLTRNTAYFAMCAQRDYEYLSGSSVMMLPQDELPPPKMCLCIRMQVQLPKRKLRKTIQMLCRDLPDAVDQFIAEFDFMGLNRALALAEKQAAIRQWLKDSDYCAFVANGSILPRSKGTDLPMENAIAFKSTPDDEIEVCGIRGMGIKKGVTVITGGGYSGKSTLLDAISAGIYNHVLGDGRELCITDVSAVSISAEDGRSVKHVNISPFIKWLPGGDTRDFSTDHASGSTSQAANIMEAVDCGAKLLLIDEDRSATNFMIRDKMMKELIEKEPITPFTDRVNELYKREGVSTILVIGGSGEYLSVADKIYMMEDYLIHDVTERSKGICISHGVTTDIPKEADWTQNRVLYSERFSSYPEGSGSEKLEVSDMGFIQIGDEWIDVRGLHDIVSKRQLDALGFMLRQLEISNKDHRIDIVRKIDELYAKIEAEGVDILYSSFFTTTERFLDLPRKQELLALINRMRKIHYAKGSDVE